MIKQFIKVKYFVVLESFLFKGEREERGRERERERKQLQKKKLIKRQENNFDFEVFKTKNFFGWKKNGFRPPL